MPNWIVGTMKVRGTKDCLDLFLTKALLATVYEYSDMKEYGISEFAYVEDSRRAFVSEPYEAEVDTDFPGKQTIAIPIKQAWSFTHDDNALLRWVNLAKKYNVDIRLQGFERGIEFYQDFAIENGEITIDVVTNYDDWNWECPMPLLGG